MSIPFYKINPLKSIDATPSPRLENEFYEFLATPKLVLLLVALALAAKRSILWPYSGDSNSG